MRKIVLFFTILSFNLSFSQTVVFLSKKYKLGFKKYNKEFDLYQKPFIIQGKKNYGIQGYSDEYYLGSKILGISPNKKYIVLDYISKGYVELENDIIPYENYFCVIIDLDLKKVLWQMQSDCSGNWNKNNKWISNGKIIF